MTDSPTGRSRQDSARRLLHNYYIQASWYARQTEPVTPPIEIDFRDLETRLIQLMGDDDPYLQELKRRLTIGSWDDVTQISQDEAASPDVSS